MKEIIYIGRMKEGSVKVGKENITGLNGVPIEVSNKAFDYLVPMQDWKGIYKKKGGEVDG